MGVTKRGLPLPCWAPGVLDTVSQRPQKLRGPGSACLAVSTVGHCWQKLLTLRLTVFPFPGVTKKGPLEMLLWAEVFKKVCAGQT